MTPVAAVNVFAVLDELHTSTLNTAPVVLNGAKIAFAAIFAPVSIVYAAVPLLVIAIPVAIAAADNVVFDAVAASFVLTTEPPPTVLCMTKLAAPSDAIGRIVYVVDADGAIELIVTVFVVPRTN